MSDFLRPAARAALWRWREALAGGAVGFFGLWWLATFHAPVRWLGWAILLGGLGFALAGLQRGRFRQAGDGPGVVRVIEGRIGYFGPLTGGAVDIADLVRLEHDGTAHPPHWILTGPDLSPLAIPVAASGAEALFDAFARLPGIDTRALLAAQSGGPGARAVIWEKRPTLLQ